MSDEFTILGKQVSEPIRKLETFAAPDDVKVVTLLSNELTSLCPVTGQPDFSTVEIEYAPDGLCIESKSLKLYLWTFREEGHFCESLASLIARDIFDAAKPHWCQVTLKQSVRGGISIQATARVGENE
jgi:7-cyano-7-deazaguanine reductase